ncbi:(d)CMP kinase [Pontivivens insulae]|uniref:Cytidylate kinase n=1 Tax=Pontivivens insulae TaxID=1639689 RepID=A0A2R8ADF0_9RHOB|nr:(d)CMP kinase [Pontivivens insulae]RED14128.1 cytidylate kinase [Pontivivens insulae]SPF30202.1 Cytidylate kinase [Pontivivens insulae]
MAFTIAIDGPAAAGKGTIAKAVAAHFGFAHLDTGLLYRATGARALDLGGLDEDTAVRAAETLTEDDLARDDLRTSDAGQAASVVAAIPAVREALLNWQQAFARRDGGAVLDGRDIGTVVAPDAEVKLYVTASDAERARRRHAELVKARPDLTLDEVLDDLKARDRRDASRDTAPMKPADDAHVFDTTSMSIDAAVAEAVRLVDAAR